MILITLLSLRFPLIQKAEPKLMRADQKSNPITRRIVYKYVMAARTWLFLINWNSNCFFNSGQSRNSSRWASDCHHDFNTQQILISRLIKN